jgi:hypothetical protein
VPSSLLKAAELVHPPPTKSIDILAEKKNHAIFVCMFLQGKLIFFSDYTVSHKNVHFLLYVYAAYFSTKAMFSGGGGSRMYFSTLILDN